MDNQQSIHPHPKSTKKARIKAARDRYEQAKNKAGMFNPDAVTRKR